MKITILKINERKTTNGDSFNVYWGKVEINGVAEYVTFKPKKTCKFLPKYCGEFEIDDTEVYEENYIVNGKTGTSKYVWVSNFNKVGYKPKEN